MDKFFEISRLHRIQTDRSTIQYPFHLIVNFYEEFWVVFSDMPHKTSNDEFQFNKMVFMSFPVGTKGYETLLKRYQLKIIANEINMRRSDVSVLWNFCINISVVSSLWHCHQRNSVCIALKTLLKAGYKGE